MATLFEEILEKTKALSLDEQLKQICDKIQQEEESKFSDFIKEKLVGPNVFLSLKVPGMTGRETCFLCLEREFVGKYITSLWTKPHNERKTSLKRTKVWEIKENSATKILETYGKHFKFMRGE